MSLQSWEDTTGLHREFLRYLDSVEEDTKVTERARGLWRDKAACDQAALGLGARFHKNFQRFERIEPKIAAAAPRA